MVDHFFFDSYALAEIIKGNPNYATYAECECTTSLFNAIELYYAILRDEGKQKAQAQYHRVKFNAAAIEDEDVFKAMEMKLAERKRSLSYADCIGYAMSKRLGIRFLTGDMQFESMPNVEFVK